MNFFYLLLLAHLMGDFPLQSDAVYRLKQKSMMGVIVHVAIFALVALIILFPFLSHQHIWAAVLLLSVFHVALDRTKLTIANSTASDRFLYFIIDQILHFMSLWVAGLWLQKSVLDAAAMAPAFYMNSRLLLTVNALIISGFAGSLLLFYAEKIVLHRTGDDHTLLFPKQRQRWPGIIVRIIATYGAVIGAWYALLLLIIPVAVYVHPTWFNKKKPMLGMESFYNLGVCMASAAWVWLAG
jgi:hypothetical protein